MKRYQAKAAELKTDAIGYAFVPFGYAAGQILAQAVTATKSLDHDKLANYSTATRSRPWSANIASARTASGAKRAGCLTQFQNIEPNNLDQFKSGDKQPILWPPEYKTGEMIYPYEKREKEVRRSRNLFRFILRDEVPANRASG